MIVRDSVVENVQNGERSQRTATSAERSESPFHFTFFESIHQKKPALKLYVVRIGGLINIESLLALWFEVHHPTLKKFVFLVLHLDEAPSTSPSFSVP